MTPDHRTRYRARAATLTLATLLAAATIPADPPWRLLLTITALLATVTAVIALGAAFAPTSDIRTSARNTLDLLLRLVPWYIPRG
ncbi:hypothetical protein [Streptomyces atratus]|uniref:hypothetical protein n=1 Tax=Streptomyces atratus TaxID=1893 RepID=UPI0033CF740F